MKTSPGVGRPTKTISPKLFWAKSVIPMVASLPGVYYGRNSLRGRADPAYVDELVLLGEIGSEGTNRRTDDARGSTERIDGAVGTSIPSKHCSFSLEKKV